MTKEETKNKLREIKQSFRLMMSGPSAQSMRDKGVGYKLNWGVPLVELRQMASGYGKDFDLAIELYKEDIRECKILATMIMPAEKFGSDLAAEWMSQCPTQEIAEMIAFNLLQYVEYAPEAAFAWIAAGNRLYQIAGYQTLARLFINGREPDERGINEYLDQTMSALQADDAGVRHSAFNCLQHFINMGAAYERMARGAMKSQGIGFI